MVLHGTGGISRQFLGPQFAAHAAITFRTFDIDASDYTLLGGTSNDVPVDPVHLDFTLGFDTLHDVQTPRAGLTVNSFNLPYATTYGYSIASDNPDAGRQLVSGGRRNALSNLSYSSSLKGYMSTGGTPNGNCEASFDAFNDMLKFLDRLKPARQ